MGNLLAAIGNVEFLTALWAFPVAFAVHEFEEWNIMKWYHRNYADMPPSTNRGARTWIVFISLVVLAWCAVAVLPGNPSFAAFVFIPAIAIALLNAFQHVYWLFYFRQYAPGIVTAVALLITVGFYLVARAVQQGFVPVWYVGIWTVVIVLGLVQTVRAGNEMTPPIRAIHHLGTWLSEKIFGAP